MSGEIVLADAYLRKHARDWRGKSVGRSYGAGHPVARMFAKISKIKVPVDLSHLHTTRVRQVPLGWVPRN